MAGTLLIVDDEVDVLGILSDYLAQQGHAVVAVGTGREALLRIAQPGARFDVAVVDWTLPDLSGGDVLQALQTHQPGCAIIVTTGHGADVVNSIYAGGGIGGILRKPFTMRTLAVRVATLLDRRHP